MSVCPRTCRHIARRMMTGLLGNVLCMYVGYHTANNVSNLGGDPMTLKKKLQYYLRSITDMALHSRDAATVSAAVATRSRADYSSREGHTSLSTALVSKTP